MGLIELIFMIALWLGGATARYNSRQLFNGFTSNRVVGGSDLPKGQYVPYQVSMQYQTTTGYHHFCGGSIIAPNRILTAAHCCAGFNVSRMSIVAGIRDLDDPNGFRSQVQSFTIHPDYKELVTSDIAVLNIHPPLVYNGVSISNIDYSDPDDVKGDVPVTLTGWGLRLPYRLPLDIPFLEDLYFPNTLQIMSYNTITNKECVELGMKSVTKTEICARGIFRGACSGDSGGPLVFKDKEKDLKKIVGVVSYGLVVCGTFFSPDVYTRVSTFRDWIQKRVEDTA